MPKFKVLLPPNVLTEVFSNWTAWNLGYLKRLIQQAAIEEKVIVEEELEQQLNAFLTRLEQAQNAYLSGAGSEYLDALNKLQDRVFPPFRRFLLRIFGVTE